MKQGIKHVKFSRPRPLWLGLALPFLLLQGTAAKAQQMPPRDSTGRVIATMPALLGDTVRVRFEFTGKRASSRPGRGIVTEALRLLNQRDEYVIEARHSALLACRGDAAA